MYDPVLVVSFAFKNQNNQELDESISRIIAPRQNCPFQLSLKNSTYFKAGLVPKSIVEQDTMINGFFPTRIPIFVVKSNGSKQEAIDVQSTENTSIDYTH